MSEGKLIEDEDKKISENKTSDSIHKQQSKKSLSKEERIAKEKNY